MNNEERKFICYKLKSERLIKEVLRIHEKSGHRFMTDTVTEIIKLGIKMHNEINIGTDGESAIVFIDGNDREDRYIESCKKEIAETVAEKAVCWVESKSTPIEDIKNAIKTVGEIKTVSTKLTEVQKYKNDNCIDKDVDIDSCNECLHHVVENRSGKILRCVCKKGKSMVHVKSCGNYSISPLKICLTFKRKEQDK